MNSSISTDHDATSHLVPTSELEPVGYSKLEQVFFDVTSTVLTSLFLAVLLLFALGQTLLHHILHRSNTAPTHNERLSPEEKRLVPDLAYYYRLLGLQVDQYEVITKDGFGISVQRIVNPYESLSDRERRKPMLLLHGLLQSSGSFCSGGKNSLGYYFFQQGYDVWLGNNRCGLEPRHLYYNSSDYRMWNWDIMDMAEYDITAMLDHVVANADSKDKKVILICHSQGTTQGFINLDSDKFGNSSKISCFVALSPAVYGGSLLEEKAFIKIIAKMSLKKFFFGIKSFLPVMMVMRRFMVRTKLFGFLSYTMFNYLFDWTDELWDQNYKYRHFLFSPVYVSVKLMSWWLNDKAGFKVSKSILEHEAQWFDDFTPPIFLVVPRRDKLVDGGKVVEHFINYETFQKYEYLFLDKYSHLDVLWSRSVISDVGVPILRFIERCAN